MFRKIHSNRDPRDTVVSELKKEFRPYVDKAGDGLRRIASRYPKFLFWMMVINISLSVILSFTVLRRVKPTAKPGSGSVVSPVTKGFDQILHTGESIRLALSLRRTIDSISLLSQPSHLDSLALGDALDRLQKLNKQLNPN